MTCLLSVSSAQLFSGVVVTINIISGFLGSILIAVVANRTKAWTSVTKLANGLGVIFAIFMMEVSTSEVMILYNQSIH